MGAWRDRLRPPAKALVKSPRHFGKAVGAGAASFAKGTITAPIGAIGKWVGAMEHGAKQAPVSRALTCVRGGMRGMRTAPQAHQEERRERAFAGAGF